jgi:hypothetical protein
VAVERNPVDAKAEFRRRSRIGAGNAQSIALIYPLLSPKYGMLAFALWSHKIMRWLVPFALVTGFVANVALLDSAPYSIFFFVPLLLYVAAIVGWLRQARGQRAGVLGIPYMFVVLNYALAHGYLQYAMGKHGVRWERTSRVERS